MGKPLLSVVIPTLNEEHYLPLLLRDLTKQKHHDFEVIVVDAYSEDNTKKSAQEYKKDLSLKIYEVQKRNVSYQRNYGAKKANGEYLVFIDADSRITTTYLFKIQKQINSSKRLLLIPEIYPGKISMSDKMMYRFINNLVAASQLTNKPFSTGGFMVVSRFFFYHIGGFNEKCYLSEDHDLVQRAKKAGVTTKMMRGVKLRFSLRRFKREGRLDLFVKYLIGAILTLKSGGIERKIFEYEMGGGHLEKPKSSIYSLNQYLSKHLIKIKNYLELLNGD